MKKTIMITGAAGFIGKNLTQKIQEYILPLDKNGEKIDLRIREKVLELKRSDIVIHLAAKTPPQNYEGLFFEHNVLGTLNILEYCVKKNVKKLIFVSSYVYGIPKQNPINEKHFVHPHNAYAKSKFLAEELCKSYGKKYGIKVIILRPFNLFGDFQKKGFLFSNIINSMKNNKPLTVINKESKRDYLFIHDFIDVIIKMIEYESSFDVFNVGSGKSYSFKKIINKFEKKCNIRIKMKTHDSKENNIPKIQADITKLRKKIDWTPKYTLEEGIEEILTKKKLLQ